MGEVEAELVATVVAMGWEEVGLVLAGLARVREVMALEGRA